MIVISDSTILIGLAHIDALHLLRDIFQEVCIPDAVFDEVVEKGQYRAGSEIQHLSWIKKTPVRDSIEVLLLRTSLGSGEAEVLVLAKEAQADLILLDEEKARKNAVLAGFKVMGVLGILFVAKQRHLIPAVRPYLEELQRHNFRLSEKLIRYALRQAGEFDQ